MRTNILTVKEIEYLYEKYSTGEDKNYSRGFISKSGKIMYCNKHHHHYEFIRDIVNYSKELTSFYFNNFNSNTESKDLLLLTKVNDCIKFDIIETFLIVIPYNINYEQLKSLENLLYINKWLKIQIVVLDKINAYTKESPAITSLTYEYSDSDCIASIIKQIRIIIDSNLMYIN